MREAVGSTFLYNIIIVFILIVFGFLGASMIYAKAFKVNTRIITSLERFEGYNDLSVENIKLDLNNIGYNTEIDMDCTGAPKHGEYVYHRDAPSIYCIYENEIPGSDYKFYVVESFITFRVPIINSLLRIPVRAKTNMIYDNW